MASLHMIKLRFFFFLCSLATLSLTTSPPPDSIIFFQSSQTSTQQSYAYNSLVLFPEMLKNKAAIYIFPIAEKRNFNCSFQLNLINFDNNQFSTLLTNFQQLISLRSNSCEFYSADLFSIISRHLHWYALAPKPLMGKLILSIGFNTTLSDIPVQILPDPIIESISPQFLDLMVKKEASYYYSNSSASSFVMTFVLNSDWSSFCSAATLSFGIRAYCQESRTLNEVYSSQCSAKANLTSMISCEFPQRQEFFYGLVAFPKMSGPAGTISCGLEINGVKVKMPLDKYDGEIKGVSSLSNQLIEFKNYTKTWWESPFREVVTIGFNVAQGVEVTDAQPKLLCVFNDTEYYLPLNAKFAKEKISSILAFCEIPFHKRESNSYSPQPLKIGVRIFNMDYIYLLNYYPTIYKVYINPSSDQMKFSYSTGEIYFKVWIYLVKTGQKIYSISQQLLDVINSNYYCYFKFINDEVNYGKVILRNVTANTEELLLACPIKPPSKKDLIEMSIMEKSSDNSFFNITINIGIIQSNAIFKSNTVLKDNPATNTKKNNILATPLSNNTTQKIDPAVPSIEAILKQMNSIRLKSIVVSTNQNFVMKLPASFPYNCYNFAKLFSQLSCNFLKGSKQALSGINNQNFTSVINCNNQDTQSDEIYCKTPSNPGIYQFNLIYSNQTIVQRYLLPTVIQLVVYDLITVCQSLPNLLTIYFLKESTLLLKPVIIPITSLTQSFSGNFSDIASQLSISISSENQESKALNEILRKPLKLINETTALIESIDQKAIKILNNSLNSWTNLVYTIFGISCQGLNLSLKETSLTIYSISPQIIFSGISTLITIILNDSISSSSSAIYTAVELCFDAGFASSITQNCFLPRTIDAKTPQAVILHNIYLLKNR